MWTLPGYGDHLEHDDPDLRKRLAEFGGPAGFEDVVASLNPIADDQPEVPAHWGVTFAVADADAPPGPPPSSAARCSSHRSTPRGCG